MKKLFSIMLTVVVCLLLFASCNTSKKELSEEGVLKVGIEGACVPFNWVQLNDSGGAVPLGDGSFMAGYDVEIAKILADGLGLKLEVQKIEWDGLIPSLTSGKIDCVIADMSPTEERKKSIDFTDIYYKSDLVVVLRKDSKYAGAESLEDFSGTTLTGQTNTLLYEVVGQVPGVVKGDPLPDHPTMIIATETGKVDGYIAERPSAISAELANKTLTFVGFEEGKGFTYDGTDVSVAVGVRSGSLLTEKMNKVLAELSEEERNALMEQAIKNQPLAQQV